MDHEVGPWKMAFIMVQLLWFDFLKKKNKPMGPSLRVNQMWTKRNDHAPKMCWVSLHMSKKDNFEEEEEEEDFFLSSLVFIFSSQ